MGGGNEKKLTGSPEEVVIPQEWINKFYERISIPGEFEPEVPTELITGVKLTARKGIDILFGDEEEEEK